MILLRYRVLQTGAVEPSATAPDLPVLVLLPDLVPLMDFLWFLWERLFSPVFMMTSSVYLLTVLFLLWGFLFVLSLSVCMQTSKWFQCVCTQTSICCCVFVWECVCVSVVAVHASLWDALISARCGTAPSCPCGWLLIETNQAYDGPIAVTPHPFHPRPNHLLIGPRGAPSRWHGRLI